MKARLPQTLAMILAVAAIVAFFLPYTTMNEEYGKYAGVLGSEKLFKSSNLTAESMGNMSLFKYEKLYFEAGHEIWNDNETRTLYLAIIGAVGVGAVLAFLCAWRKHPILLFLCTTLMTGGVYLVNWDMAERMVWSGGAIVWGIASNMYYPLCGAIDFCALWLLIAKRKDKKRMKNAA